VKETERLKAKLARLVAETGDSDALANRTLEADDSGGLLSAIVREIDETILGRELAISNDRQERITLEVSGRRLLRITAIPQAPYAADFAALVDRQISDPDRSEVGTIADLLAMFVDGSAALRVTTRPLQARPGKPDLGCSSEVLAAACARRGGSGSRANLDDFRTACAEFAIAWVQLREGDVVDAAGSPEIARRLADLAQSRDQWSDDLPAGASGHNPVRCTILSGADEGSDILVAVQGDCALFMAFVPERIGKIVALWFGPSGHRAC
jgi:hypothetical protein